MSPARLVNWIERHSEVYIGVIVGLLLGVVFVFVLKYEVEQGLIWLVRELTALVHSLLDDLKLV